MKKTNQWMVDTFNQHNKVGTQVILTLDDGTESITTTTSEAYVMGEHTPVIHLEGVSGCYLLERVKAVKENG